ncbi:MAG: hypothetical protein QOG87_3689 [Actinomycetota bacterium]|jgi:uncharacterized damage-inducible protein DinB
MPIERIDPGSTVDERAMLRGFLDYHRQTLLWKCDGLSAEQLRLRSVPPSSMSLLGLVRHLADVERSWFRRTLAGEDAPPIFYSRPDNLDGDFDDVDDASVDDAFARWNTEVEASRRIEASFASLDDTVHDARHDADLSVRWVLIHMVEEYSRHNGHADLLREQIDGATGE